MRCTGFGSLRTLSNTAISAVAEDLGFEMARFDHAEVPSDSEHCRKVVGPYLIGTGGRFSPVHQCGRQIQGPT